jgi:hypothetical protein
MPNIKEFFITLFIGLFILAAFYLLEKLRDMNER